MTELLRYSDLLKNNQERLKLLKKMYDEVSGDQTLNGKKERIIINSEIEEVITTINNAERFLKMAEWNKRLNEAFYGNDNRERGEEV